MYINTLSVPRSIQRASFQVSRFVKLKSLCEVCEVFCCSVKPGHKVGLGSILNCMQAGQVGNLILGIASEMKQCGFEQI